MVLPCEYSHAVDCRCLILHSPGRMAFAPVVIPCCEISNRIISSYCSRISTSPLRSASGTSVYWSLSRTGMVLSRS